MGYRAETYSCIQCGKEKKKHAGKKLNKFCSTQCHKDFEFTRDFAAWMTGAHEFKGHKSQRRALSHRDGYKCATCGIFDWNGRPITFEVEHRDGNPENNHQSNLELICPNCHSQTSTYKAKNRGNGRHARRQRYAEGKSY